jgi:sulfite reductase (ferredoxin)
MSEMREPILRLPASVKRDMAGYRENVRKFVAGDTSGISFKAYRVLMGIYEQRTAGKYMVRIRIGAGLVWSYQLEKIAELSKTCGNGVVHVTTRQGLQIHEVDIEKTPNVLEGLLEVGLSSRGGGGNTVRNITTCPHAGVCPQEVFNVAPYAIATAEYLLDLPSSFELPRKFKLVFSGCPADCASASVADLGFFAHVKEGQKGFAVYAGGGLGRNPRIGIQIEEFIRTDEILEVAEAVKRLFDKYGDRTNRQKARLRYVLGKVGAEEFVKLYRNEREKVHEQGLPGSIPEIRDLDVPFPNDAPFPSPDREGGDRNQKKPKCNDSVIPEKTPGFYTVRLKLKLGDIPADDLVKVAQIAEKYATGLVRTTQLQGLFIPGVPAQNLESVMHELTKLSIEVIENHQPKIVACTGAATCKLGLCLSRGLAAAIGRKLQDEKISPNANDMIVRISGCPNSCGNHYLAGIGFEGKVKRINGRRMPFYEVLVGAKIAEGNSQLAEKIGSIPAKRIPEFIAEAFAIGNRDKEQLKIIVKRYSETPSEWPEEYYHDFDAE